MNTNFTWSTTEKGEKAILYNGYLYRLRRENQNGSLIYVCTFKWYSRTITLKNNSRYEQEQAQKRTTRRRKGKYIQDDNKLMIAKKKYTQDEDLSHSEAYKKCIIENYQKIELCLIETFSQEWYDDLCSQDKTDNHRFYFHIITDKEGNIISVEKDRLFKGMTEYEFKQFAISLKKNFTICIFPPRGMNMKDFRAKYGNRLPFSFLYFPYKTRAFLEDWRLNNNE